MNCIATKFRSLALLAAVVTAAAGAGCSGSSQKAPIGSAKVGVTVSAATATNVAKMTLTVGPGSGIPSFSNIVVDLTNNDLTNKLSWSGYVQNIPAGNGRTFHVDAFDGTNKTIYTGDATANITAGATATVYMVLQDGNSGFTGHVPVVDTLTSSASSVTIGTPAPTVALAFTAHDPDGAAMTYGWTATCGSLSSPSSGPVVAGSNGITWTAPSTVPAGGACQVSLTLQDTNSHSVTAYLAIVVQQQSNGTAVVNAYPNSWPVISGIVANETFTKNSSGQVVAIDVDLTANASDTDGDDLGYAWSFSGCTGSAVGFTSPTAGATVNVGGPSNSLSSSAVHFHSDDIAHACVIKVGVSDYWKNGIVPVGSGLPVARGGDTVGTIYAAPSADFVLGPQITNAISPNATNTVQPGQTVTIGVQTLDPTPTFNQAQTPFTFTWTQTGGAFVAGSEQANTGSPGQDTIQWTAASTWVPGSSATVTVTNKNGQTTSWTWKFQPSNICGQAGSDGQSCDTGQGLCAPNGVCQGGSCVSPTPVTCAALDQCHVAGICGPSTGQCTNPIQPNGTACNDTNGCTTNDVCTAGVCGGATVACTRPADTQCQSLTGTCVATSDTAYTCQYTNKTDGTSCDADKNGCTQNDSCQSGICTAGAAVNCTQSAVCQASTGTCNSTGSNTYTCSFASLTDGTACNTAGACVTGQTCVSGACQGGTPYCPAGDRCDPAGPTCIYATPAPQVARDLQISPPAALSMDTTGSAYISSAIFAPSTSPVSFDGISVFSQGGADVFLAKYNTNGQAIWAKSYGDANDQYGTGSAVTADGTMAVIGNFSGQMTFGSSVINSTPQIDFLAAVHEADGSGVWAKQFNDGSNGMLKAVAANPSSPFNRIAVCGLAVQAATDLVGTGATYGGQNDIVIAMFDSAGNKLWAQQIGGSSNEECDALAIDDNGNLYAAGKFDGATLTFGTLPALTGPNYSLRKFLWVAKFDGATGAALESNAFGGSSGQATPNSLAVDAMGNVVLAGSFTSQLPFGGSTSLLASAGSSDVFVAKLAPALSPIWSVRMGGTAVDAANSVAVTSFGDVLVTGLFNKTTTGAAALTAASTTASDAFVLSLDPNTGATDFAAGYGDSATQTGDAIVVNRYGSPAGNQVALSGTLNSSITFPAPAGKVTATGATDAFFVTATLQ